MRLALLLSALCGFIALSYEIVWVRIYTFLSRGAAYSFGALLGAYLLGLALGSLVSLRFQEEREQSQRQLASLSGFVLLANALGFFLVPAVARLVTLAFYPWSLLGFALVSLLLGATFPLICHFAIPADDRAGARLSYLYLANITGSGAGSLLTGFVLMDHLTLRGISLLLALLGLALAAALDLAAGLRGAPLLRRLALTGLLAAAVTLAAPATYAGIYERLQFKRAYLDPAEQRRFPFRDVVETKGGVVTVDRAGSIYGGGTYDGVMYTHPAKSSWIIRPYCLSALHPTPRRVLMIGLSGGTWANIIAHNPDVRRLTVIEINEGYLEIVRRYDSVKSLLSNPRVEIVIDDGRRWLLRHPEARFDAIVTNTTHHWRAYASNLLSVEYLRLVQSRLAPGGIYYWNATSSLEAERTALHVFRHALMVINCIAAGDRPIVFDKRRWTAQMRDYSIDGRRLFDLADPASRAQFEKTVQLADTLEAPPVEPRITLTSQAEMARRSAGARLITDDNMATEWKKP